MFELVKKYRREFFYTTVLFILWEMSQVPEILRLPNIYMLYGLLGSILISSWTISSYISYSNREISRFTDVLLKIQLRDRFFLYFVLPILLFFLITFYLYINVSILLNQFMIVMGSILYLFFFVHIRSSYEKVFSIAKYSKVAINFIDIVVFYLVISILVLEGSRPDVKIVGVVLTTLVLLGHQLILHNQKSLQAIVILILSTMVMLSATLIYLPYYNIFFPIVLTIIFYVIVSWWNIRLDGYRSYDQYIPPILFALMGFIILMSF